MTRSARIVIGILSVAAIIIGVLMIADLGPFAPDASEIVSAKVGYEARCRDAGRAEIAGEREKVWRCTYRHANGQFDSRCFSVVDGKAVDVTSQARDLGC